MFLRTYLFAHALHQLLQRGTDFLQERLLLNRFSGSLCGCGRSLSGGLSSISSLGSSLSSLFDLRSLGSDSLLDLSSGFGSDGFGNSLLDLGNFGGGLNLSSGLFDLLFDNGSGL